MKKFCLILSYVLVLQSCFVCSSSDFSYSPIPNPLCHDKDDLHLYYNKSQECLPLGSICRGEESMEIYPVGDGYGDCECTTGHRDFVYWAAEERCYPIFAQGPCKSNKEWLNIDGNDKVVCEPVPNICLEAIGMDTNSKNSEENFWFHRFDKCWKQGMDGICPDILNFQITYHGYFDESGKCIFIQHSGGSSYSLPCKKGQKYSSTKLCKSPVYLVLNPSSHK